MASHSWSHFSGSHFHFYLLVSEWCAPTDPSIVVMIAQKEIKAVCRCALQSAEHNLNIKLNIFIQAILGNSQTGHIQQKPISSSSFLITSSLWKLTNKSNIPVLSLCKKINILVASLCSVLFSLRRSCAILRKACLPPVLQRSVWSVPYQVLHTRFPPLLIPPRYPSSKILT